MKYGSIKAEITGMTRDYLTGDAQLILTVPKNGIPAARDIAQETTGKTLTVGFADYKHKRSVNANNLCWELCTQIADATGVTKEEVYRNAIMHGNEYTRLSIAPDAVDDFRHVWGSNGVGWTVNVIDNEPDGRAMVFAYYGSSVYDTKSMSGLIDRLMQDAKAVGIPTISDEELTSILSAWKN